MSAATLEVTRDGKKLGLMTSEKRQHFVDLPSGERRNTFQPSTEVAIKSDIREDLYIVYAGSVEGTEEAVYRITIIPLVWWLWYGGGILAIGGLITMWPGGPSAPTSRRTEAGYAASLGGAARSEESSVALR